MQAHRNYFDHTHTPKTSNVGLKTLFLINQTHLNTLRAGFCTTKMLFYGWRKYRKNAAHITHTHFRFYLEERDRRRTNLQGDPTTEGEKAERTLLGFAPFGTSLMLEIHHGTMSYSCNTLEIHRRWNVNRFSIGGRRRPDGGRAGPSRWSVSHFHTRKDVSHLCCTCKTQQQSD